jgi:hypothetical protein
MASGWLPRAGGREVTRQVARAVTPRTRVSGHARRRLKRQPVTFLRGAVMMVEFFVPYFLLAIGCLGLTLVAYGLAFP